MSTYLPLDQIHARRSRHFDSLYRCVTQEIWEFRQSPDLNEVDHQWLEYLIVGFDARYRRWLVEERRYLRTLYRQDSALFTLAAHAYLHVCLDLPLVIFDSLDPLKLAERPAEADAERLYAQLREPLARAVSAKWDRPTISRVLFWRVLGLEKIFLAWLWSLRLNAWIQGRQLLATPVSTHPRLARLLRNEVTAALVAGLRHRQPWSKVFVLEIPPIIRDTAIGAAVIGISSIVLDFGALLSGLLSGGSGLLLGVIEAIRVRITFGRALKRLRAPPVVANSDGVIGNN